MHLKKIPGIILVLCLLSSCSYKKRLTAVDIDVHPYYTSNMVFQTGLPITLSGKCSSNGKLAVLIENVSKVVDADQNGDWSVTFPKLDFKGSFSIKVEGKNGVEVLLNNVITGNLWVIVGDNWKPYSKECFSTSSPSRSFNDAVRYFQPNVMPTKFNLEGSSWKVLAPENIYDYEKLTRTIGERLQDIYNTPVGIINLSWPGTHIVDFANNVPDEFNQPENVSLTSLYNDFDSISHVQQFINDSSFRGIEKGALDIRLEDWDWNDLNLPVKTGRKWYLKDRIVWLRRKFYVSDKYRTSDFGINFGTIRGGFVFYVNGNEIDRFEGETTNYTIQLPDSVLRTWTNLLTIRMNTSDSLSGFYSDKILVANHDSSYKVNIDEGWVYKGYLEPKIPKNTLPVWSYPRIYNTIVPEIRSEHFDGIIVAGGYNMYRNLDVSQIQEGLENIHNNFKADKKLLCLPPQIGFVDSLEMGDYYLKILNAQLKASAHAGYKLINLSDIQNPQANDYSIIEISERIIENLER